MRMVWRVGDGDGDSSAHVVERSMNLVRGHPTWKLFMDKVETPIKRGSTDEPPHYCYLDDRACFEIYSSNAYNNEELRKFWPWDFNHQGNIKQGRLNRGKPAWTDDSHLQTAQGKVRAKNQWYTFYGEAEEGQYEPLRPKKKTHIEEQVAREFSEQADEGAVDGKVSEPVPSPEVDIQTPVKKKVNGKTAVAAVNGTAGSRRASPTKAPSTPNTPSPSKPMAKLALGSTSPSPAPNLGTFNPKLARMRSSLSKSPSPSKAPSPSKSPSPTKTSPLKRPRSPENTPAEAGSPTKRANTSKTTPEVDDDHEKAFL